MASSPRILQNTTGNISSPLPSSDGLFEIAENEETLILILMVASIYMLMTDSWWSQLLLEAFQHSRSENIEKQ